MNPLVYISAGLYFEITGAEISGGEGTIEYAAVNLGDKRDIAKITDEYVDAHMQAMANFLHVPRSAVRLISKEEYDRKAKDEKLRIIIGGRIMERQYTIKMTITIYDEVAGAYTLPEVVFEALEDAPFQVDCIQVD